MSVAAVIPARFASSRFPGKPLARIGTRPMIEWVYRRAVAAGCFDPVLVATDDERIAFEVGRFGGQAVLTSSQLRSGSERVWMTIRERPEITAVVNIQGDEPLVPPPLLRQICDRLGRGDAPVVSAAARNGSYDDLLSPHVVKVVVSAAQQALYFSRSAIPFVKAADFTFFHQHVGIYGYRRDALAKFVSTEPTPLERMENLEQLRFLESGIPISILVGDYRSHGVDVPGDVTRIEKILELENE